MRVVPARRNWGIIMKKMLKRVLPLMLVLSFVLAAGVLLTSCRIGPPEIFAPHYQTGDGKIISESDYTKKIDKLRSGEEADPLELFKTMAETDVVMKSDDVGVVLPAGFAENAALHVQKIRPPQPLEGTRMLAYDFNLDGFDNGSSYFDIRMSYKDLKLPQGSASDFIGAAYYNPSKKDWEPVIFEIDENTQEIVIKTNHFSVYSCFLYENEATREAKAYFADTYKYFRMLFEASNLGEAYKLIALKANNAEAAEQGCIDYAKKVLGAANSRFGESFAIGQFVADSWVQEQSHDFSNANRFMARVGLGLSIFKICRTAYEGWNAKGSYTIKEQQEMAGEALTALIKRDFPQILNSTAGVVMLLSDLLDKEIKTARANLVKQEIDAFTQVFNNFNTNLNPWTQEMWKEFILTQRRELHDGGVLAGAIMARSRRIASLCVEEYKNRTDPSKPSGGDKDNDILDYGVAVQEAGLSKRFGGLWRTGPLEDAPVRDEVFEGIIDNYQRQILATFVRQAVLEIAEEDYYASYDQLVAELKKAMEHANEKVKVHFYDPTRERGKSQYANCWLYMVAEDDDGNLIVTENWMVQLDRKGEATIEFTRSGWYSAGEPERVFVLPKKEYQPKDILLDMPDINWQDEDELRVPLVGSIPLQTLAGHYSNGKLIMDRFELSARAKKELSEIDDSDSNVYWVVNHKDAEGLTFNTLITAIEWAFRLHLSDDWPFRIKANDDEEGYLIFSSGGFTDYADERYEFTYDEEFSKLSLVFEEDDDLRMSVEMQFYHDPASRKIKAKGIIKFSFYEEDLPGDTSFFSFRLEGERDDDAPDFRQMN